jgi:RNA polymerase sigma factor (sigma-70 family)
MTWIERVALRKGHGTVVKCDQCDRTSADSSWRFNRAEVNPRLRRLLPPHHPDQTRWFLEHVQPHEGMLRAWLRSRFPVECDIDDIVQEAYARVLQASETNTIDSPKAFLFATARNLALGRVRHQKVSGVNDGLAEIALESVLDESADVPHAVGRAQELELLTQAIQPLPARCRQVLTLRKIYGLSQKAVAAQLGIAEHTVEAQGTIGLRKLAEYFERIERQQRPSRRE